MELKQQKSTNNKNLKVHNKRPLNEKHSDTISSTSKHDVPSWL